MDNYPFLLCKKSTHIARSLMAHDQEIIENVSYKKDEYFDSQSTCIDL